MTEKYTPSPDEIRQWLTRSSYAGGPENEALGRVFDACLAEVRREAWTECEQAILAHIEKSGTATEGWPRNPYKKEGE